MDPTSSVNLKGSYYPMESYDLTCSLDSMGSFIVPDGLNEPTGPSNGQPNSVIRLDEHIGHDRLIGAAGLIGNGTDRVFGPESRWSLDTYPMGSFDPRSSFDLTGSLKFEPIGLIIPNRLIRIVGLIRPST